MPTLLGTQPRHHGPLDRRAMVITERFSAGESVSDLAWDYDLSPGHIAQIVRHYGRGHDRARQVARLVRVCSQRAGRQGWMAVQLVMACGGV